MPKSATTQTPPPTDGEIVDLDLSTEMRTSFLEYAYSVIYARALPDARDGLKPVQRRILFQMDRMGLRPDLLIGDFDSVKPPEHAGCEVYSYPPEKDDTDMLLALKCGLERGFRLDHTIANFTVLAYAIDHGAKAVLQDEKNAAILLRDSAISVPVCPGFKLSVFPYGGGAKGVCLRGVKYPLEDYEMDPYCTLGVSNEILPSGGEISVKSGTLLLVFSKD